MSYLILPILLIFTLAPTPEASKRNLGDLSRFSKALNKEIVLVNTDGTVTEGVIAAVDANGVTMKLNSGTRFFANAEIASADRMKDGRIDGAIKGGLFGLLLSVMASQGLASSDDVDGFVAKNVATFAALGYAIDAGNPNRQRLYQAPAPPPATMLYPKLSLSFRF